MNNTLFDSSQKLLNWAWQTFGAHIVASSSFQTQSVVLLHIIAKTCSEMPIVFIDTTYHFPETLEFRDRLQARFDLNVHTISPDISAMPANHIGEHLCRHSPDICCQLYKVEPMKQALRGMSAWVTGIRQEQTVFRRHIQPIDNLPDGLFRICPLANWTQRDIQTYITENDLPCHPLFYKGYLSIGCAPCTEPIIREGCERSGRWKGTDKTECGLHTS